MARMPLLIILGVFAVVTVFGVVGGRDELRALRKANDARAARKQSR